MQSDKTEIFIIVSKKKGTVWKNSFHSRTAAQYELDMQLAKLPFSQQKLVDWEIQSRFIFRPINTSQAVASSSKSSMPSHAPRSHTTGA